MQKIFNVVFVTVFSLSLGMAASADAQFWPGYGYVGGGYGAWGAYTAAMEQSTNRYIAQQDRLAGQMITARQTAAMQNNIRNTLYTQAEMRTQNIINQDQSNRDWWFQVQQQQLAQRQHMAAAPGTAAAAMETEVAAVPSHSEAKTDIIKWPSLLREARFAEQRALVEAPYRRDPGKPAKPTVEDYENMMKAAEQMKILLGEMAWEITAQDYLQAERFLNQLAQEAGDRIKKK